jgi:hypothetical protein
MARINIENTAPFTGRLEAFAGNPGIGEWLRRMLTNRFTRVDT